MKKKLIGLLCVCLLLLLSACSSAETVDTEPDNAHSFMGYPVVYITMDVSAEGLLSAYEALEPAKSGASIVKLSESEEQFQWEELTELVLQAIDEPTVVETFSESDSPSCDSIIFLTHFESHEVTGFRGTIANLSSITDSEEFDSLSNDANLFMKLLAERGKEAADNLDGVVFYITVLDHWSIDDDSQDICIVSSYDPVALDQACIDLVNRVEESQSLAAYIASRNGNNMLMYAEQGGLGSCTYAFLGID